MKRDKGQAISLPGDHGALLLPLHAAHRMLSLGTITVWKLEWQDLRRASQVYSFCLSA